MQKHVNLVDLVKSFPTNIYLQNLASIQKRTSHVKFAHLAEKSGNGSISNLSTKAAATALEHAQMFHARKAFFRDTVTVPLLAFEEVQVPDTYRSRFKQHVQRIVETGEIVPLQPWKQ